MKLQKRVMAFLLVLVMIIGLMPASIGKVQAEGFNINLGSVKWSSDYSTYTFPNVTVSFNSDNQKIFCISVNNEGSFVLPSEINLGTNCRITGIEKTSNGSIYQGTVSGGMELSSLTVIGTNITKSQVVDFIKALTFKRNGLEKEAEQTVSVVANEVTLDENMTAMAIDGVIHYYEYIEFGSDDETSTWYTAYDEAKSNTFDNMNGYLATITEENEQLYLYGDLGGQLQAWIGGARTSTENIVFDSDTMTEGSLNPGAQSYAQTEVKTYYWMCGPEAGEAFYETGNVGTSVGGQSLNNAYSYWNNNPQEPNNQNNNRFNDPYNAEYALEYGYDAKASWNDYSPYNIDRSNWGIYGYIIEYSPYTLSGTGVNPTVQQETTPSSTDSKIVAYDKAYPNIVANNFIITVDDANTATEDTVKTLSGATRYESEGTASGTDNVTVSNLDTLKAVTEPDVVTVTLKDNSAGETATDKEVTATVVDKKTTGTSNDGEYSAVVIGANHFNISEKQANAIKGDESDADVQTLVKELANAVATENGIAVDVEDINVSSITISDDPAVDSTATFEYKGQQVTVVITIQDNGSTDGALDNALDVPTTNLTANDFTIDAGSATLDEDDFITEAEVSAKDSNGSSVTPTVNADDLEELNNAIENNTPGTYDVEVTTPDGTTTTVTVTVTKRYPNISGNDFIISVADAKDVTEPEVKILSDATRYDNNTDSGDRTKVTVSNLTDLKNQTTAGEVVLTLQDNTSSANPEDIAYDKTVKATVVDATSTSDVNASVVVGANNFCITVEQAQTIQTNPSATADMIKILANAVATDAGSSVDPAEITVNSSMIKAENGSYDVTFTYGGQTVTVTATVKDDGVVDNASGTTVPTTNLTANDFAVEKGGDTLSADVFLEKADVVAKKNDGTPVTPTVNQDDLDALNNAIQNGPTGDYTVTVTAPDGTSTKVTVSVTDVKTDETGKADTLAANNFTISVNDVTKITGADALDEVLKRSDAQAYEVNTKKDVNIVSVDTSEVGNTPGETYNVTLMTENGTTATIQVTVTSTPGITAKDFNISIEQAETIVSGQTNADVQDMVKALANAVAKEDSTVQDGSKITVDASKVKATKGTYPVTFTYNGKTVTVNATVKDTSAADGDADKTDVPEVNLTANDFTVQAGSTMLTPADFNKKAEVVAKKNNGTAVIATPNATDLQKLNNAIKNCQEGTYEVKVTSGGETVVVTVTVTKEKDVVGDDRLFEISNAKDIPQALEHGREVSTVNVDGTNIPSSKYTINGDTITIDSSVFQNKKEDTTSKVVITYKDGSKRTFNVKIVAYDKATVVTKVPIFQMQKDLGVRKKFTINLVGMNKYSVKSFKSSNKRIATVDKNGVITGKKKGKCTITAKIIQNGSYYTVKIKLHVKKSMKMYNLKKKALQKQEGTLPEFNVYKRVVKGKKTKMNFTNVDKNAKITYTTSNKKIATVSKKGVIQGKKKGFCVVTAKIEQRGHAYYTKLIVRVDDGTKNKQLSKYLK